jgi:hypothetical protein
MFTRRSRTVSFRVSEEEYEHLEALCIAQGVRTVSDAARDALRRQFLRAAAKVEDIDTLRSRLDQVVARVDVLDREICRILAMMSKGPRSCPTP